MFISSVITISWFAHVLSQVSDTKKLLSKTFNLFCFVIVQLFDSFQSAFRKVVMNNNNWLWIWIIFPFLFSGCDSKFFQIFLYLKLLQINILKGNLTISDNLYQS